MSTIKTLSLFRAGHSAAMRGELKLASQAARKLSKRASAGDKAASEYSQELRFLTECLALELPPLSDDFLG